MKGAAKVTEGETFVYASKTLYLICGFARRVRPRPHLLGIGQVQAATRLRIALEMFAELLFEGCCVVFHHRVPCELLGPKGPSFRPQM